VTTPALLDERTFLRLSHGFYARRRTTHLSSAALRTNAAASRCAQLPATLPRYVISPSYTAFTAYASLRHCLAHPPLRAPRNTVRFERWLACGYAGLRCSLFPYRLNGGVSPWTWKLRVNIAVIEHGLGLADFCTVALRFSLLFYTGGLLVAYSAHFAIAVLVRIRLTRYIACMNARPVVCCIRSARCKPHIARVYQLRLLRLTANVTTYDWKAYPARYYRTQLKTCHIPALMVCCGGASAT